MPKFRSLSNLPTAEPSPSGDAVYKYTYELNGEIITEEWQVQEEIESYAEGCDVNSLIKRYQESGDSSVLNSKKGFFADVSDMPTDLIDVYDACKTAKKVTKVQTAKVEQTPVTGTETTTPAPATETTTPAETDGKKE